MQLASPTHVRALLDQLEIKPSRALGQNFLIDANIVRLVLEAADLEPGDRVLEVGPGLGVLTHPLAERAARLTAVEKDRRLAAHLREVFAGRDSVRIVQADMLELDPAAPGGDAIDCVVSNLPYQAGTRVLVDLVRCARPPRRMVVTVQAEVADRLAAAPGTCHAGLLGTWVQRLYRVSPVHRVRPTCFWPVPEIDSMIVRLDRHDAHPLDEAAAARFYALTRLAFTHPRKQVAGVLRQAAAPLAVPEAASLDWLAQHSLPPTARPGVIPVAAWCELARRSPVSRAG